MPEKPPTSLICFYERRLGKKRKSDLDPRSSDNC